MSGLKRARIIILASGTKGSKVNTVRTLYSCHERQSFGTSDRNQVSELASLAGSQVLHGEAECPWTGHSTQHGLAGGRLGSMLVSRGAQQCSSSTPREGWFFPRSFPMPSSPQSWASVMTTMAALLRPSSNGGLSRKPC